MIRSLTVFMVVLLLGLTVASSTAMVSTLPAATQPIPATLPAGTQPVPATLPAPPGGEQGYFSIQSIPSGSDCYFDNIFQGETPVMVSVSTTGNPSHSIRISAPGYDTWTQTYQGNPKAGQTITITATLTPSQQDGNIQVVSTPSGAMVTLDRTKSAMTPYTFYNVPEGTHEIIVYMSGYQDFYTDVNVIHGQTAYVNAVLQPVITTGSLSVSSSPSGAAVYVDGSYRGVTSTTVGNLVPGQHTVKLILSGYLDWTATVSISAGSTTYIDAKLVPNQQPTTGSVSLTTNPPGAFLYVNGVYAGQTSGGSPLLFPQAPAGTYSILITKAGYQDYTENVIVEAGKVYTLTITLTPVQKPTTGGISVISSPSQSEVFLNNAFKGLTPITLDELTPGTYTVLLKLSGYQDWQTTQQVIAGQTSQISATLIPVSTPTPTQTGLLPLTVIAGIGILILVARKGSLTIFYTVGS